MLDLRVVCSSKGADGVVEDIDRYGVEEGKVRLDDVWFVTYSKGDASVGTSFLLQSDDINDIKLILIAMASPPCKQPRASFPIPIHRHYYYYYYCCSDQPNSLNLPCSSISS